MAAGRDGGAGAPRTTACVFHREGDYWTLSFDEMTVRAKDAKGLRYIAQLLKAPGREIPALELIQTENTNRTRTTSRSSAPAVEDLPLAVDLAQDTLDRPARTAYEARIRELEEDITDADARGDAITAERARHERDTIATALAAAYGLGGRTRKFPGDTSERARKAVTERIRTTLTRIETAHPVLGNHLRRSIRTGTFCSYTPDRPVRWNAPDDTRARVAGESRTGPLDVLIVDDHPLWRDTVRQVLEHAGVATVVAEASDGSDAIELARRWRPDVVLMDVGLPDRTGSDVTEALLRERSDVKVLVLSSSDERRDVVDAVAAGASGYLVKTAEGSDIVDAVRRVHAGELVFPAPVSRIVLSELHAVRDRTDVTAS
jgi:CheY-like chemotaxis protein